MIDGNAWRCLLLGLYCDYGWKRFDGAGCQITHSVVASPTSKELVAPISSYRFEHCSLLKEATTWACHVSHYSMHVVWICVSFYGRDEKTIKSVVAIATKLIARWIGCSLSMMHGSTTCSAIPEETCFHYTICWSLNSERTTTWAEDGPTTWTTWANGPKITRQFERIKRRHEFMAHIEQYYEWTVNVVNQWWF
jgi:hypothetical protein